MTACELSSGKSDAMWPEAAITLAALSASFAAAASSSSIRAFLLEGSATSYAQFGKWLPAADGDWDHQQGGNSIDFFRTKNTPKTGMKIGTR